MVLIKSFVLAGLAAAVAAKSAVLDLIPDNFDKVVLKSGKPTLVEFFAPWCGHCKKLAPVYEELGEAFAKSDAVQIAKVDADAEKSLGKRFGVQGFPTLKWFDGKSDETRSARQSPTSLLRSTWAFAHSMRPWAVLGDARIPQAQPEILPQKISCMR